MHLHGSQYFTNNQNKTSLCRTVWSDWNETAGQKALMICSVGKYYPCKHLIFDIFFLSELIHTFCACLPHMGITLGDVMSFWEERSFWSCTTAFHPFTVCATCWGKGTEWLTISHAVRDLTNQRQYWIPVTNHNAEGEICRKRREANLTTKLETKIFLLLYFRQIKSFTASRTSLCMSKKLHSD